MKQKVAAKKKSASPTLHQKILGDIRQSIISGEWPPGFRLPFEVELAKSYQVSRMTVNKVLTKLAGAGLIERHKRSGTFVTQPQAHSAILEIHDIEKEVRSLNRDYKFTLLSQVTRKTTQDELRSFGLSKEATILDIHCAHFAGDTPFCYEERLINLGSVPEATKADFTRVPPGQWLRMQVPWSAGEHKIYAMAADELLSQRLRIPEKSPCLVVQRRTWRDEQPVTFVRFTYPAEKHVVVAHFTPASS